MERSLSVARVDVLIIGGGAAGLMCALTAGQRGRSVLVLEHAERLGKKILISGGGRCNFTNREAGPDNYLSGNPSFCKSALARYTPADFIALVEKHGIAYHEKKLGQLFCDFSSRQIVELLERECAAARVQIRLNCAVQQVERHDHFRVRTSQGVFEASSLVIATGGLSFPKLGATDFGYRLAAQFGLKLAAPRPGLVPLIWSPAEQARFGALSGISVEAIAHAEGGAFRENILFTHRGLSGPAILQISNYLPPGQGLHLDLLPDRPGNSWLAPREKRDLKTVLAEFWPQRLAHAWSDGHALAKPLAQYSARELETVSRQLHAWPVLPVDTEGYPKAEVTLGGVDTSELSSRTLECRRVPGLYFIGEVVDVTGWLGGYNFQWAWASGHAAGEAV